MIIRRSEVKQLLKYKKACELIYEAMTSPVEDTHGNVSAYRYDRVHKEILNVLESVGYGKKKIVGFDEWKYTCPWEVSR